MNPLPKTEVVQRPAFSKALDTQWDETIKALLENSEDKCLRIQAMSRTEVAHYRARLSVALKRRGIKRKLRVRTVPDAVYLWLEPEPADEVRA